ncbi:hypoxanthine phosphoribosyltransferase [Algoriphagus sp. CAU 1675]|uniref:hypoxanthine phosphoribosyltransferase n=1 Tax=Algoriphagus sp. CAU 1675 TaxID=3032597 RepID=UPI0023DC0550|nr:hypoxanthine phosphoribosyltransferase [Algoriphagus sp. CAU 1675]MDF2158966.1 hypoxanthine phosphoribosyltransferase [Algoriphagus sp. CAU 1675]
MSVVLKDKTFEVFLSKEQIQRRVLELGRKIAVDFQGKDVIVIGVLNGCFMFFADLCRAIEMPMVTTFIKVSSYQGTKSTEKVKTIFGLSENIEGKKVLIVEDIVDTGFSMKELLAQLKPMNPESISIATLLFKPEAFRFNYAVDYVGFEIPNKFVVGYGLDYDGLGRNLPEIYQLRNS